MNATASKYLALESIASAVVNGILNYGAAYGLFHKRSVIPTSGPESLLRDLIGETFLVTSLSALAAFLISRQRRRTGKLPDFGLPDLVRGRNVYGQAAVIGLIFTGVFMALNTLALPRLYPGGTTFGEVLWFKTIYGAVLGGLATFLAIHRAVRQSN